MQNALWHDIEKIRSEAPLVHNITNYVAMNTTANALLALGASPVMAHAIEEVEEMAGLARALVINIGTLSSAWVASMQAAVHAAKAKGVPIVLDPVGAGATKFRTETARNLLALAAPCIVRGNASEVLALGAEAQTTKGVDSTHTSDAALVVAQELAARHACVVSISGATDLIVAADRVLLLSHGDAMMTRVTGMGCVASALTGAMTAVSPSLVHAAAHAMAVMGIVGEKAALRAHGPGSFQVEFMDALYTLQKSDFNHLRVQG
ncbi:MAG: hydroxyethylthiazole kinase [Acidobacteriaceae bacterium]